VLNHPLLTDTQKGRYRDFCTFVAEHVAPFAGQWDKQRAVPIEMIHRCGRAGFIGGIMPPEFGGSGWDMVSFGLLNEAFGAASSSLCSIYTVQTMVAMTLAKWGTKSQQEQWLPPLCRGERVASFALTEPRVGSDVQAIETVFTPNGMGYRLNGVKKWITYSAVADLLLVFGKLDGKPLACLVETKTPGVKITPLPDMLGFRAAHLSQIEFVDCPIKPEDLVGRPGFALSYVAPYGLHFGRMSTAWSAAGLLRACLQTSAAYASRRRAFDQILIDHGTIRHLIADMGVNLEAARELCLAAALADDAQAPEALEKTLVAKYFSSRAAMAAAADTVQIMGAAGCHEDNPAARYYRDAKITEIIEGTNQIQQKILGKSFCRRFDKSDAPA